MAEHLNARTETEQKASGAIGRRRLLIAIASVIVLAGLVVVVRNATGDGDGDAGNSRRASDEPRPIEEVDAGGAGLTSVAFSPDGSVLAVGDLAGLVHLVDPETGETTATIESGEAGVHAVAFSPDGSLIAGGRDDTGADTGSVSVWDSETRELLASLGGDGELDWIGTIDALAFSPDGRLLAGGDFGSVRLWDVEARRQIAVLEGQDSQVQSVAFSPDGRLLAAGGLGSTIDVWDVETGERVVTLPQQYPMVVAFSPDGRHLAAGMEEGIGIWDIEAQERVETLGTRGRGVLDLVFSPDGSRLVAGFAAGDGDSVGIWDTDTNERVGSLEHGNFVGSMAISSDGRMLATQGGVLGDAGGGVAGFVESGIRLWNPDDL